MSLKRFRAQFNIPRDIRKDASFFLYFEEYHLFGKAVHAFGVFNIH